MWKHADRCDQRMYMQRTTQWRFTVPTHVVAALDAAVAQYVDEGGFAARGGRFYQEVKKRGYILYPGKLTEVDTFRVGCIGHFGEAGIPGAIADTLKAMGVRRVSAEASA